jgi:putative peptide zinc metalloprotease protein
VAGVLAAFRHEDMAGTYVRQGELLGYVLDDQKPIARFVVSQEDVDLLRRRLRGAQLRLSESLHEVHEVSRWSTPVAGVEELPSAALGLSAGGNIPTRPDDPQGVKTLQRVFLIDLELPANVRPAGFGGRAYARFDLGWEPLGWQGIRRLRQLFLGYFGV